MNQRFGPGILVTAAFIGPGTITTATVAGANFGFALLWAVLFSVIATFIMQEMASRLGLATRSGLAEAVKHSIHSPILQKLAIVLIISAIVLGNAAYEAGNLIGASLGINALAEFGTATWSIIIASIAGLLLWYGRYQLLERVFTALVLTMSLVFIATLVISRPSVTDLLAGLVPSIPAGSITTILALIGTTLVPYNLFLHASMVQERWKDTDTDQAIKASQKDTVFSISLGGLITLAILGTSAGSFFNSGIAVDASSIAQQLQPMLGDYSTYFFALGIFAAGITSAIAAPLAAAYALSGALGFDREHIAFKLSWLTILLSGAIFSALGTKPISAILFAQAANGLLLPFIAVFLLVAMNNRQLMKEHTNARGHNIAAGLIVLLVSALGCYKLIGLL